MISILDILKAEKKEGVVEGTREEMTLELRMMQSDQKREILMKGEKKIIEIIEEIADKEEEIEAIEEINGIVERETIETIETIEAIEAIEMIEVTEVIEVIEDRREIEKTVEDIITSITRSKKNLKSKRNTVKRNSHKKKYNSSIDKSLC